MSHIGVVPTGESPSAGPSQRKPPAARIDESAVVPVIPITSRAHHLLVYQTRIERRSPVGADSRNRTDGLDLDQQATGLRRTPVRTVREADSVKPNTRSRSAN